MHAHAHESSGRYLILLKCTLTSFGSANVAAGVCVSGQCQCLTTYPISSLSPPVFRFPRLVFHTHRSFAAFSIKACCMLPQSMLLSFSLSSGDLKYIWHHKSRNRNLRVRAALSSRCFLLFAFLGSAALEPTA